MLPTLRPGPPQPVDVRTPEELGVRLQQLRSWSGLGYREIHRRVLRARRLRGVPEQPAFNTVYRCLQPQRRRVDVDLVLDVVAAMLPPGVGVELWRQAHAVAFGPATVADVVTVDPLPPDPDPFVGRRPEVASLLDAVAGGTGLLLVDGMPGVGKSRLAAHLAHRVPAGGLRLWLTLRGNDPVRPSAVAEQVLRRLDVAGCELTGLTPVALLRRCRTLLAGRVGVLVLDDAAGLDQVWPLLPRQGTVVVVTSRYRLPSVPGGRRLELAPFRPAESLAALRAVCGSAVVDADPAAARRVGELTGHLPLALLLAAGRMRHLAGWTMSDHAECLAERRSRLVLDPAVAAALDTSYAGLRPEHQELLRRLALRPGAEVDDRAAAALAGASRTQTRHGLAELVRAHLVAPVGPGRVRLHDVVAVFALRRARDEDSPSVLRHATDRLEAGR